MRIGIARASANAADICGDVAGAWTDEAGNDLLAIADGLGHGRDAAVAAGAAITYIGQHRKQDLTSLFDGLAAALAQTRGAAVGVARIDRQLGRLSYAALGNTRAAVFGWQAVRLDSTPGIVGRRPGRLSVIEQPIRPGSRLVLWTDGVEERLSIPPGQPPVEDPDAFAQSLLQRYRKGDDDACVLVARLEAG